MHFKLKNGIKWCYFTLSKYAIIILNNLVNTARRMEEEKNTDLNVFYVVFFISIDTIALGNICYAMAAMTIKHMSALSK